MIYDDETIKCLSALIGHYHRWNKANCVATNNAVLSNDTKTTLLLNFALQHMNFVQLKQQSFKQSAIKN